MGAAPDGFWLNGVDGNIMPACSLLPCRDQVPDGRVAFGLKAMHRILLHPIGIGHALMLSHVVEPGFEAECLDEDTLF